MDDLINPNLMIEKIRAGEYGQVYGKPVVSSTIRDTNSNTFRNTHTLKASDIQKDAAEKPFIVTIDDILDDKIDNQIKDKIDDIIDNKINDIVLVDLVETKKKNHLKSSSCPECKQSRCEFYNSNQTNHVVDFKNFVLTDGGDTLGIPIFVDTALPSGTPHNTPHNTPKQSFVSKWKNKFTKVKSNNAKK